MKMIRDMGPGRETEYGAGEFALEHMNSVMTQDLHREISRVLNYHGVDSELNLPDHVLARVAMDSMIRSALTVNDAHSCREGRRD
ncbi:MAG: hypothetical protein AAF196_06105 [Planctomycetota bacterium]